MLVLLPPSEGKASPEPEPGGGAQAALRLDALSLPGLTQARERVLAELVALCEGAAQDDTKAREVLGLSEGLRGEIVRNAALRTAPVRPAGEIYTGVLYDALGLGSLDGAARERAGRWLLVFSGLWGALRVGDPIPSYRCSGGVKLPGTGGLGAFWRGPLESVLPEAAGDGLVLDLRSSAYAAMWKPKGALAERTATVRVLQSEVVGGVEKRSVVSHFNKATKGRLVRSLLEDGAEPGTPEELAGTLERLGHRVETAAPTRAGQPWRLDVVVTEVH
ncbi:peroxide stress protein YaaA [Streptomyces sp. TRM 70351]|uniref:peroxide stress protein YaaA n=1 Tax=Streptomyces sp. TRM 70351 TaxID=3116552 RepID=UPI002E7C15C2|nr:peroxide stress protein YaaA [Streptomyces sp. TRM 70351]MEE1928576.1 peroxide stress protein YaaA [Streptomyces sp. TRM 70351]